MSAAAPKPGAVLESASTNLTIPIFPASRRIRRQIFKTTPGQTRFYAAAQKSTTFDIDYLAVGLNFYQDEDTRDRNELYVNYRVSIITSNGSKRRTKEFHWHYIKSNIETREFDFHYYLDTVDTTRYLVEGTLTLFYEVDIIQGPNNANKLNRSVNPNLQNYATFLESGKLSDVTFVVESKEFALHKAILAAQSPVFAAMFEHDNTKEALENRVDIPDINVDVMEELVRYLYSGEVVELDRHALDLFVAADKYQLEHLKSLCVDSLSANLSIDSASSTLLLADMHNAPGLKSRCIDYINANSAAVQATEGWTNLLQNRMELVVELYKQMATRASLREDSPDVSSPLKKKFRPNIEKSARMGGSAFRRPIPCDCEYCVADSRE